MIYEDAITNLRRNVSQAFKNGMQFFPHFTLHGEEHLEELDRLALLIGGRTKPLAENTERLNLLRLAIVIHDFAMVQVPDREREEELRAQMEPDLSFADVVRKVHQDEIENVLTQPEKITYLTGLLPDTPAYLLEDASTIARYHRFHALDSAPEHLRELCALMRVIDELDIGPKRAPLPAYEALRGRMDSVSKFHWLKHMCTRPIEEYATFSVEERHNLRVLRVSIAVKATQRTWRQFQSRVISKIQACLEDEGANQLIREAFQTELQVAPAAENLSGPTGFLHPLVKADLEDLVGTDLCPGEEETPEEDEETPVAEQLIMGGVSTARRSEPRLAGLPSPREFKVIAIPPETLDTVLCESGRLTVIRNKYVRPKEEHIGGVTGALSRVYVGPADCGKTRAATERVRDIVAVQASQWVILRTDIGTIPDAIDKIVLDTTLYDDRHYQLPAKAILFLDDLPLNFPPAGSEISSSEAVQRLFEWFRQLPYFRQRCIVGTIRIEDIHGQPDWPDVLPSLGEELELLRVRPLDPAAYVELWRGMASGSVSPSVTRGTRDFSLEMDESFIDQIRDKGADPEAVATFVQQAALMEKSRLGAADAAKFSSSAVETWLNETWPAIEKAYGPSARVFFSLARYLEPGIRLSSGHRAGLLAAWEYHAAFGPKLCETIGGDGGQYLRTIHQMGLDGHAVGKRGEWIRPRADYVLQADVLRGVEVEVPPIGWFLERASHLSQAARVWFGAFLRISGRALAEGIPDDVQLAFGWGLGAASAAEMETDTEIRKRLLSEAANIFRRVAELEASSVNGLYNLGVSLGRRADAEDDGQHRDQLRDEEIEAYREAVQTDPKFAIAWNNLGVSFSKKAATEENPQRRQQFRDQAVEACRKAVQADPQLAQGWNNLGAQLSQKGADEDHPQRRQQLHDEAIDAFRRAVQADPRFATAWYNLGVKLEEMSDAEEDSQRRQQLRDEAIEAYGRAVQADRKSAQAWYNLGVSLGRKADIEEDPQQRQQLRDEGIEAYRKAVEADAKRPDAWNNLGVSLDEKADAEHDPQRRGQLRDEAVDAYRHAVQADPEHGKAWHNLGVKLDQKAAGEEEPELAQQLREQGIQARRKALEVQPEDPQLWSALCVTLIGAFHASGDGEALSEAEQAAKTEASLGGSRYNLACVFALRGRKEEALIELEGCLQRGEISKAHAEKDKDWDSLRDDPEFQRIMGQASD